MPIETFEIINNDDLNNGQIQNNKNSISDNSSNIIIKNKQNTSNYGKDDENSNIFDNQENINKPIKTLINISKSKSNDINTSNFNEKNITENNNIINNNNNNDKIIFNNIRNIKIDKNKNKILLYKRKKLDSNLHNKNNNISLNNSNNSHFLSIDKFNNNTNNQPNFDIQNISPIRKTENKNNQNNSNSNFEDLFNSPKNRTKTPIIYKPRNNNIKKNIVIIKKEKEYIKPTVFNQSQLHIAKTELFDIPKETKIYISKTPSKKTYKKTKIIQKPKIKLDFKDNQKDKMTININEINDTIKQIEQKIKSIEQFDKKNKIEYNIDNISNNNINIKPIRNVTPLEKNKRRNNKKNINNRKTFDENDAKGYADRMPLINRKREEKEKNKGLIYTVIPSNKTKSIDIKLRRKNKKIDNREKYPNINNYIFGKQKYNNQNNDNC